MAPVLRSAWWGAVTDHLGADALIGSILRGLVGGGSPQDALNAGMLLAARTIGHFGAFGYGFEFTPEPPSSLAGGTAHA